LWIDKCQELKITITAKDALEAIAVHQGFTLDSQTQPRPQFTSARFIDALAEFIVATDQVRLKAFYFILYQQCCFIAS
jgi:hypothetical protein